MAQQEKDESIGKQKVYNYMDLAQFEPENLWGGFGKMQNSKKKTEPKYGFGTADREKQAKVFQSKELSKIAFVGKTAPGPNYDVTDKYTYDKVKIAPEWKIGTDPRNTLNTGAKFDHYLRADIDFDPLMANDACRQRNTTVRIGLESRFPNDPKRNKGTPGPHYNPSIKQEIPIAPKYTFGFRRQTQGKSLLAPDISTPDIVGPGHYMKQQIPWISSLARKPTYSVPKADRVGPEHRTFDKYQTYDYKQKAIGPQVNSRKATMPEISIGRAKRNNSAGMFKQHMSSGQSKVCIPHPKF